MKSMMKVTAMALALVFASAFTPANAGDCGSGSKVKANNAGSTPSMEAKAMQSTEIKKMDIVEVAVSAGTFGTLVTAVKAAELVDVLKSEGPFTVFAPTDEAFAKLPDGAITRLLADKDKLAAVLTYHVIPGKVMAADVVKLSEAATANGQSVNIKVDGDKVFVDGAQVVKTDIECENGVIHVIDNVILPDFDK